MSWRRFFARISRRRGGCCRPPAAFAVLAVILLVTPSAQALAIGADELDRFVFVANRTSGKIAVIDARLDRVIERIDIEAPPHHFVLSSSHGLLIASFLEARQLVFYDLEAMRTAGVLDLDFRPDQIQLDGQGALLAAADTRAGIVALIGLEDRRLRNRLEGLPAPGDLVFDRSGRRLFVASAQQSRVEVIDTARGALAKTIRLGPGDDGVSDLVRTPGGTTALALHGESGRTSVIDLDAGEQVAALYLPGPASRGFPSPDNQYFLVANERDATVSRISTWTHRESARLPATGGINGINFGMFGTLAFAIDRQRRQALALDLIKEDRAGALSLPGTPETSITAEAGTKLYIALGDSHQIAVIDIRSRRLTTLIGDVGREPWAVNRAGGLSYCH